MPYLLSRFMKMPIKHKRSCGKKRPLSPTKEEDGCDNPAFQASMMEAAVGEEDTADSEQVGEDESPPPLPPPRQNIPAFRNP